MSFIGDAAGVPALLGESITGAVTTLLVADAAGFLTGILQTTQWGLYLDGIPVISADTVGSVEYKKDWTIATYPIEEGGFETYDKVSLPFEIRIRFAAGGSPSNRQALLASIDAIAGDTNLYDLVTPEVVYLNVNVSHYDYKRAADSGVGLLIVELWCQEIRIQVSEGLTNTQSSTSTDPIDDGQQNAQTPTSNESAIYQMFGGAI